MQITNIMLGAILLVFTAIGIPVFVQSIVRHKERDASMWFAAMCASNALWAVFNALFYLLSDEKAALLFYELRLVLVGFSALFTYLFILKSIKHVSPHRNILLPLFLIPVITGIVLLTNQWHHLMRVQIAIVQIDGVRVIQNTNGLWFYVHCIVSYTYLFLGARLVLGHYRRLPHAYRLPLSIMLAAVVLTACASLASIFNLVPYSFDFSPIVVQIAQVLFFYALFNAHSLDMMFTSREAVFENGNNPIFIVNTENRIMDYNAKARGMGEELGVVGLYDMPFDELMEQWISRVSGRYFHEDPSIITVHNKKADVHYQITKNEFYNNSGKAMGTYIELKNITPIMSLVHKLQDMAYYDQLTGLLNRRSFVVRMAELDREDYLPLGIVMGDVNFLKTVNDTYGHAAGDLLLQAVTEILQRHRPPGAAWFRIGGDEFVGFIPNTTQESMEQMVADIILDSETLGDERFACASMAAAFELRHNMDQSISTLMEQADRIMYQNKWNRRA